MQEIGYASEEEKNMRYSNLFDRFCRKNVQWHNRKEIV